MLSVARPPTPQRVAPSPTPWSASLPATSFGARGITEAAASGRTSPSAHGRSRSSVFPPLEATPPRGTPDAQSNPVRPTLQRSVNIAAPMHPAMTASSPARLAGSKRSHDGDLGPHGGCEERADAGGEAAGSATGSVASSSKPSKKPKRIPRPMNSFMVFAKAQRKLLQEKYPDRDNKDISKMLGQNWGELDEEARVPYVEEAKRLAEEHKVLYPEWRFKRDTTRRKRRQQEALQRAKEASMRAEQEANAAATSQRQQHHQHHQHHQHQMYAAGGRVGTMPGSAPGDALQGANAQMFQQMQMLRQRVQPSHAPGPGQFGAYGALAADGSAQGPPASSAGNLPTYDRHMAYSGLSAQQLQQLQQLHIQRQLVMRRQAMLRDQTYSQPPPTYVDPPSIDQARRDQETYRFMQRSDDPPLGPPGSGVPPGQDGGAGRPPPPSYEAHKRAQQQQQQQQHPMHHRQ